MFEPGTRYTHYKGGKYEIVAVAHDATNTREGKEVVVYKSVKSGEVYCRDKEEFVSEIAWPDGVTRPRFVTENTL